jgi:uncharacterized damage-inducible protein DinB
MNELQYPIGKFEYEEPHDEFEMEMMLDSLAMVPAILRGEVDQLSDEQLDTPYRPEGWTLRQVVHHLADSHINAYTRFKLALTEIEPVIKTYDQELWAETFESKKAKIDFSLDLLDAVHRKWNELLRSLDESDLRKSYFHPETGGLVTLMEALSHYDWHGRHHIAHITTLKQSKSW